MLRRTAIVLIPLAIFFLVAPGANLRNNELIIAGGSGESDGFWISGPSLYLRRDTPAVTVAMVRSPGQEMGYAYVLIVKGDEKRKVLAGFESKSQVLGSIASSGGFIEIANRKASVDYRAQFDPAVKNALREELFINGKTLDLSKGRVVLVDLSTDNVTFTQTVVELPKSPTWPTQTPQVEVQAKMMLEHLRREDKQVRSFLK